MEKMKEIRNYKNDKRSHAFVTKCHAQRHHMWAVENRHYLVIDLPTLERFRCVRERRRRRRHHHYEQ